MNRRDFFKIAGAVVGGVIIVPALPKPMTNKVLPPDPGLAFPPGTFIVDFDRFLAEDCAMPYVITCTQETYDEIMAGYPEWANMRRGQFS